MKPIYFITVLFIILSACTANNNDENNQYEIIDANCDTLPKIPFELDPILKGMQTKLIDSLWSNFWLPEHNRIIEELNAYKTGAKKLFPYSDFDSTVFVFYEPQLDLDNSVDLEKRKIKSVRVMCQAKANLLLNIINDPLNYSTGECGTSIPFSKVVFYLRNKKVGELTFACNYTSISSTPENVIIFGNLNNRGDSLLDLLKPWN